MCQIATSLKTWRVQWEPAIPRMNTLFCAIAITAGKSFWISKGSIYQADWYIELPKCSNRRVTRFPKWQNKYRKHIKVTAQAKNRKKPATFPVLMYWKIKKKFIRDLFIKILTNLEIPCSLEEESWKCTKQHTWKMVI